MLSGLIMWGHRSCPSDLFLPLGVLCPPPTMAVSDWCFWKVSSWQISPTLWNLSKHHLYISCSVLRPPLWSLVSSQSTSWNFALTTLRLPLDLTEMRLGRQEEVKRMWNRKKMKLAFFSHRTIFNLASFHTIPPVSMYLEFQEVTPSLSFLQVTGWLNGEIAIKAKLWVKLKFLESNCKSLDSLSVLIGIYLSQIEFVAPSCPGPFWYSDGGSDLNNAMPNLYTLYGYLSCSEAFSAPIFINFEVFMGKGHI